MILNLCVKWSLTCTFINQHRIKWQHFQFTFLKLLSWGKRSGTEKRYCHNLPSDPLVGFLERLGKFSAVISPARAERVQCWIIGSNYKDDDLDVCFYMLVPLRNNNCLVVLKPFLGVSTPVFFFSADVSLPNSITSIAASWLLRCPSSVQLWISLQSNKPFAITSCNL